MLTKYEGDRSSFEILSPDNDIPLKNLGLTSLTEEGKQLSTVVAVPLRRHVLVWRGHIAGRSPGRQDQTSVADQYR